MAIDIVQPQVQVTGRHDRGHRRRSVTYVGAGTVAVGVIAGLAVHSAVTWGLSERALATSWQRAVEADGIRALDFDRASSSLMHPVSSGDSVRPLVVGERVTLVTPDGVIHTLRVCDPASAAASVAPDCLAGFAARAVVQPGVPVPQRSL